MEIVSYQNLPTIQRKALCLVCSFVPRFSRKSVVIHKKTVGTQIFIET